MRSYMKRFRVSAIGDQHLGDGLFFHVLISHDAQCWQVERKRDQLFPVPWAVGEEIEVPLAIVNGRKGDRRAVPDWEEVEAYEPVEYDLSTPYATVSSIWGAKVAQRHLDPDPQPHDSKGASKTRSSEAL